MNNQPKLIDQLPRCAAPRCRSGYDVVVGDEITFSAADGSGGSDKCDGIPVRLA
jgi:hypothetical protein